MVEGEDSLLFLGRVDKAAGQLALVRYNNSVEGVNQHIVEESLIKTYIYTIQRKPVLARQNIPRSEIDEIIRDVHFNAKVEKGMLSNAMSVNGVVDPQALYAGVAQPAGGGSACSGGEGRQRRAGRFKSGQQQQQ